MIEIKYDKKGKPHIVSFAENVVEVKKMFKIYCRRCKVYMTQTVCKMIKGKTCTKGCKGRSR
jgi:hypothetical protein